MKAEEKRLCIQSDCSRKEELEELLLNARLRSLDLEIALTITRGQWIHSIHKDQCLRALKK